MDPSADATVPTDPPAGEPGTVPCATCGAPVDGRFCARCGERRLDPDAFRVGRYAREAFADLTDLDGKVFRSLRMLALRPGSLTREYMAGRRVPFLRPIQTFLLANLVYFLVQPYTGYTGYNTTLGSQINRQVYRDALDLESRVRDRVAELAVSGDTYARLFDQQSGIYARTLVIAMIPLFALALAALLWRHRRPLVEHLVFATHAFAFELLFVSSIFLFAWQRVLWTLRVWLPERGIDLVTPLLGGPGEILIVVLVEFASWLVFGPWLFLAARRAYALGRTGAAALTGALLVTLTLITIAYRLLLFWLAYWTVG